MYYIIIQKERKGIKYGSNSEGPGDADELFQYPAPGQLQQL
jgi:hypothetical protein